MAVKTDDAGGHRISIFLNVFDVHVNRTPIGGKVACVTYKKGQFLVASKEDASAANEQNVITVDGVIDGHPTRVVFKQIAGLIARRHPVLREGGQRGGSRPAHRPDEIRLAHGCDSGTGVGSAGESRAAGDRRIGHFGPL